MSDPCRPPVSYSDPRDVEELAEPLRSRIRAAIADAPTGGLVLVSGYRTPWMQWLLRHERVPGHECDPAYPASPVTALPGRSRHNTRQAADMGGRELAWLIANRAAYGLALTVRSENWHFEADAVDVRTGRRHHNPTAPSLTEEPDMTPEQAKMLQDVHDALPVLQEVHRQLTVSVADSHGQRPTVRWLLASARDRAGRILGRIPDPNK